MDWKKTKCSITPYVCLTNWEEELKAVLFLLIRPINPNITDTEPLTT